MPAGPSAREQLLARVAAKKAAAGRTVAAAPATGELLLPSPPRVKQPRRSGDVFSVGGAGSGAVPAGVFADCIGVDVGAVTACVAAWDGQSAKALSSFQYPAEKTVPVCVTYPATMGPTAAVGIPAYRAWPSNFECTVGHQWKEWLGKHYDSAREVDDCGLRIVRGTDGRAAFACGDGPKAKQVYPEEVCAAQVARLRDAAVQDHVREQVRDCVLCVPAAWGEDKRALLQRAMAVVGDRAKAMRVRAIITDAEACLIACGVDDVAPRAEAPLWLRKTVVVCDFGGSGTSVTVLKADAAGIRVLAAEVEPAFSGLCVEEKMLDYFLTDAGEKFPDLAEGGKLQLQSPADRIRFLTKCREAKEALSGAVPRQTFEASVAKGKTYQAGITKLKLERMMADMLLKVVQTVDRVLAQAGLSRTDDSVDEVIVAGGMSRMTKVQQEVRKMFKDSGAFFPFVPEPDHLAALGAAIKAASLCCSADDRVMPPRVPCVAHVCGQTLGVACVGDEVAVVVHRNEPFPEAADEPIERIMLFRTSKDNQAAVDFHLLQGGEKQASRALLVATLRLDEVPKRPQGDTEVILRLRLHRRGTLEAVCWVQGAGHSTGYAELTFESLYGRKLSPFVVTDPAALPELEPVGDCVHVSTLMHVADVPKDAEDLRLEEARDKEWRVAREKERRDRRARLQQQRQQREQRESQERAAAASPPVQP
eukprot:TRINITY_DN17385_c0_g1_i1.p1 TRINITY_DN17385_c0_g1~~TRINITY_DN17385_c0_g1_i1.p1  ORF type:complete len:725 (+),score=183.89 TRINITY_DN17385_c0_g1_i1:61-2175(+)